MRHIRSFKLNNVNIFIYVSYLVRKSLLIRMFSLSFIFTLLWIWIGCEWTFFYHKGLILQWRKKRLILFTPHQNCLFYNIKATTFLSEYLKSLIRNCATKTHKQTIINYFENYRKASPHHVFFTFSF